MFRALLFASLCYFAFAKRAQFHHVKPLTGAVSIDPSQSTILGLSAGGFFASQFHVAFSSSLIGAAIVAGGPFYCAQDSLSTAQVDCQYVPSMINLGILEDAAKFCASSGVCDSLDNLTTTRVYIFSGTKDTVVNPGVVKATHQFYLDLNTPAANIKTEFDYPAEHSFPTNDYGNSCGSLGSPYINNCNYDSAFDMLNFLYGNLSSPTTAKSENLFSIKQQDYTPNHVGPASLSLGEFAYVYVPQACRNASVACKFTINMHGCQQTMNDISYDYIAHTGVNEVAEANNIVVLWPQAIKSYLSPLNPEGCFDWWGYTNSDYSNQRGPQMQTVYNMMQAIIASPPSV